MDYPISSSFLVAALPRCVCVVQFLSSPSCPHSRQKSDFSVIPPARLNRPERFHPPLADADTIAVQVHRRAAMPRDHFQAVAHADGGIVRFRLGMFLGKSRDPVLRPALD